MVVESGSDALKDPFAWSSSSSSEGGSSGDSGSESGGSTLSQLRMARDEIDDDFLLRLQPLRAILVSIRATNTGLRALPSALFDSRASWPRLPDRLGRPHDEPVSKAKEEAVREGTTRYSALPGAGGGPQQQRGRRRSSAMDHMPLLREAAKMRRMSYKMSAEGEGAGRGSGIGGLEAARRLSGAELQGMRMGDVPHLPRLQVLEIRSNKLTRLPHTVGPSTPSLRSIDASTNALVTLPRSLGTLERLASLDVSSNRIEAIPEGAFASMRSLRRLNLARNRLSELPASLGRLPRLRWLNLSYNRFITVPSALAGGAPLRTLMLNNNRIATIAPELCGVKTLQMLQLSGNSIFGLPRDIGQLSGLEALWLDWNRIDRLPIEFAQLRDSLKDLRMEGNPLRTPPADVVHAGVPTICDWIQKVLDDGIDRRKRRVARHIIGVLQDAVQHCLVDPSFIACNVSVDRTSGDVPVFPVDPVV